MKVRCVQLFDVAGTQKRVGNWLTIGATYHVLEILGDPKGKDDLKFRIMSDNNQTPTIERASQFELITNSIPRCWSVSFLPDSLLYFAPFEWIERGFWERYFDKNELEQRVFERNYREIVEEDP
jgi:hypothetical protein